MAISSRGIWWSVMREDIAMVDQPIMETKRFKFIKQNMREHIQVSSSPDWNTGTKTLMLGSNWLEYRPENFDVGF